MSDVEPGSGRVREHVKAVEPFFLREFGVLGAFIGPVLVPEVLPLFLDGFVVIFAHSFIIPALRS
jgi:hypothetical protein